jgi:hypothetical protein
MTKAGVARWVAGIARLRNAMLSAQIMGQAVPTLEVK